MSKSAVTLRGIHVCDRVSRDLRGLPELSGIYPHVVRCTVKPAFLRLSLYAAFSVNDEQAHKVEFLIQSPQSKGEGVSEIKAGTKFFDMDTEMPIFAREDALLTVKWRVDGGRWATALECKIAFQEDAVVLDDDDAKKVRRAFISMADANGIFEVARDRERRVKY